MIDLANKVAVVTGGASGIGFALAQAYGQHGVKVLIADVDEQSLNDACERLQNAGIDAVACIADLRDPASLDALAVRARELGTIGVVCMNAGISATGTSIWEMPQQQFDFIIDVNLRGLYSTIRSFVPALLGQGASADIVITASMAGMVACPMSGAYSASKAGAVALAKALHEELAATAPYVRVVLLSPGMVKTNLFKTSAVRFLNGGSVDMALIEGNHGALNHFGVPPEEVAGWVMRALEQNRFFVFPPEDDMFSGRLLCELETMKKAISNQ